MEADGLATALEHDAPHIVVQDLPGTAAEVGKRLDMAAHEVGERRVEVEAQERVARVAEHHDEGHERSAGSADLDVIEVGPVDLRLLRWQGAQSQIGLARRARA